MTRRSFIVSSSNADAARALWSWPAWPTGLLALVGPAGSGKTHLARAWAAETGGVFLSGGAGALPDLDTLRGRTVALDDADTAGDEEFLFHLINLAVSGGGLLLSSRRAPPEWPAALPDLRSRLNGAPIATLGPPDDTVLGEILARRLRERNIRPSEDLIPYLLRRIERSASAAARVAADLDERADALGRPVSRALAREILGRHEADAESGDETVAFPPALEDKSDQTG